MCEYSSHQCSNSHTCQVLGVFIKQSVSEESILGRATKIILSIWDLTRFFFPLCIWLQNLASSLLYVLSAWFPDCAAWLPAYPLLPFPLRKKLLARLQLDLSNHKENDVPTNFMKNDDWIVEKVQN